MESSQIINLYIAKYEVDEGYSVVEGTCFIFSYTPANQSPLIGVNIRRDHGSNKCDLNVKGDL